MAKTTIPGRELRIGDTIEVLGRYKTVNGFGPHSDPHNLWGGKVRIARLAPSGGITIPDDQLIHVCRYD